MAMAQFSVACLLSMLPGPPSIKFQDSVIQAYPVSKLKCPYINPEKDVTFEIFTRPSWLYLIAIASLRAILNSSEIRHYDLVKFRMTSMESENPLESQQLRIGNDKLLMESHIDFTRPTVVYFHAFLENSETGSALRVTQALLLRGDCNLILIDAERLTAGPWYFTSVDNTFAVGLYAAKFIDYLVTRGLNLKSLHLIGHSLGAQMAGVCGHYMRSGKPSRITGLDPALPMYNKLPLNRQLDKSDADFVDIIHTDAGIFGITKPMGHVDFYPNGGLSPQPGCELEVIIPRAELLEQVFCSHWKSYQFFAESILRPEGFLAAECKSWEAFKRGECSSNRVHMGYGVSRNLLGGGRSILPIIAVMRESNTKIHSLTGNLDHFQRERNTFLGSDSIATKLTPFGLGISITRDNAAPGLMSRLLGLFGKGGPSEPGGFKISTSFDAPK